MAIEEIRTIMAPLTDGYVVLPNSAVAEVMGFVELWEQRGSPDFCKKSNDNWTCE